MLQTRGCKECGISFEGGPRAYYCLACRKERQTSASRESKRREREGLVRKLGSIDNCEKCLDTYIVKSGLQRFCEKCAAEHAKEHDRKTSLEYYHENKTQINPVRNKRRRDEYKQRRDGD